MHIFTKLQSPFPFSQASDAESFPNLLPDNRILIPDLPLYPLVFYLDIRGSGAVNQSYAFILTAPLRSHLQPRDAAQLRTVEAPTNSRLTIVFKVTLDCLYATELAIGSAVIYSIRIQLSSQFPIWFILSSRTLISDELPATSRLCLAPEVIH